MASLTLKFVAQVMVMPLAPSANGSSSFLSVPHSPRSMPLQLGCAGSDLARLALKFAAHLYTYAPPVLRVDG